MGQLYGIGVCAMNTFYRIGQISLTVCLAVNLHRANHHSRSLGGFIGCHGVHDLEAAVIGGDHTGQGMTCQVNGGVAGYGKYLIGIMQNGDHLILCIMYSLCHGGIAVIIHRCHAIYGEVVIHSIVVVATDTHLLGRQVIISGIGSRHALGRIRLQTHCSGHSLAADLRCQHQRFFGAGEQVVLCTGLADGSGMLFPCGELADHQVYTVNCILPTGKVGFDTDVQSIDAVLSMGCVGSAHIQTAIDGTVIAHGVQFHAYRVDHLAAFVIDGLELTRLTGGNQLAIFSCEAACRSGIQSKGAGILKADEGCRSIVHSIDREIVIHRIVVVAADTYLTLT